MNKRRFIFIILILIIIALLFIPFSIVHYDDGGTVAYGALAYKIVVWERLEMVYDTPGAPGHLTEYQNTSVFWFPFSLNDIDELWELEKESR